MASCDDCKIICTPYVCTIGPTSNLCSYCYAKKIRVELVKAGYAKSKLEMRIKELTTDPDKLEQYQGVCGFAACVREMLQRPEQARNLFEAAFHHLERDAYGNGFRVGDGSHVVIPFPAIMGKLSTATTAVKSGYFVDWILCRALTHVLSVANRSLFDREVNFSDTFGMGDWHGDGHFAIQTDSLTYVARALCKLKVLWVLKHDYAPTVKAKRESSPRTTQSTASLESQADMSDRGLLLAREMEFMLDGSTSMFTAIHTGHLYDDWANDKVTDGTISTNTNAGAYTRIDNAVDLPFNHWVVIDGAKLSPDKKSIAVNMWSWHRRRTLSYPLEHLTRYFREAVFVKR